MYQFNPSISISMKKKYLLYIALFSAITTFQSCGSDDEDDNSSVPFSIVNSEGVGVGETKQLYFEGKIKSVQVANDFIANVDKNGRITGKHAGITEAIFNNSTKMRIWVNGKETFIGDMWFDWGVNQNEAEFGYGSGGWSYVPGDTQDMMMSYKYLGNVPVVVYGYGFSKNTQKLESATLIVHRNYIDQLAEFLKERFYMVEYQQFVSNYYIGFSGLDSDTPEKATTIVSVMATTQYPNYVQVMFMPYSGK